MAVPVQAQIRATSSVNLSNANLRRWLSGHLLARWSGDRQLEHFMDLSPAVTVFDRLVTGIVRQPRPVTHFALAAALCGLGTQSSRPLISRATSAI